MEKISKITIVIIFLALFIIILFGCSQENNQGESIRVGDFELTNIINDNFSNGLDFYFYYETPPGAYYRTATYVYNAISLKKASYTFERSFSAIYPVERIRSIIGEDYRDSHGQVMIYGRNQTYEFIVTNKRFRDEIFKNKWIIVYIENGYQREIVIQTNEEDIVPTRHFLHGNTLYLLANIFDEETGSALDSIIIYKINLDNETYKYDIYDMSLEPFNQFRIIQMIMFDGKIYLSAMCSDESSINFSYILSINIGTHEMNYIAYYNYLAFRVLEYENQILVLKTGIDGENVYIDFLDDNKNIVGIRKIYIPLDENEYLIGNIWSPYFVKLFNGEIYFTLASQMGSGRYIVVYNIENGRPSYLGFAYNADSRYRLMHVGFFFSTQN